MFSIYYVRIIHYFLQMYLPSLGNDPRISKDSVHISSNMLEFKFWSHYVQEGLFLT